MIQFSRTRQFKPAGGPRSSRVCLLTFLFSAGIDAFAESVTSTNVGALSGALPDTGASVIRVFGALILVVGIFLGGVWLLRTGNGLPSKRAGDRD